MEQSLTIRTEEYTGNHEFLVPGQGLVPYPRLRWAPLFNILQDTLGRPTGFRTRDFLIVFEFAHDVIAVFCTQGRRRGEIVVSTDSRNPHAGLVSKVEAAVDELRDRLAREAIDAGLPPDALDDWCQSGDEED